jgi:hypothetical protein
MTDLATLKKRLLADPATQAEYEAQAPDFAVARELIAARVRACRTDSGTGGREDADDPIDHRTHGEWPHDAFAAHAVPLRRSDGKPRRGAPGGRQVVRPPPDGNSGLFRLRTRREKRGVGKLFQGPPVFPRAGLFAAIARTAIVLRGVGEGGESAAL